jgi:ABC-type glycerol-3-phosphate transport system substrate-binding protein
MAHQTRRAGTLVLALLFAACSGQTASPAASSPASVAPSTAASEAPSTAPSEAATEAPSASQGSAVIPQTGDLADFTSTINWQAAKGQKIFVAMTDQTDTDVLAQALPQFTKLTGIEVDYQKYEDVTQKELVDLQAGTGSIDVMQLDSQVIPQYVKSGYLADLGTFMADPTQYDASWYKPDDLVGSFVDLGKQDGKLYAIPAYLETTLLYYRKDLFDAKGIAVPNTIDDVKTAAAAFNDPSKKFYGWNTVGQKGADQNVYRFMTFAGAYGAKIFKDDANGDYTVTVNSPEMNTALSAYAGLLKDYGPPGVANWGWDEAGNFAAAGGSAMYLDTYDEAQSPLDDPSSSKTVGKWGCAATPGVQQADGSLLRWPSMFSWMLGVNAASQKQTAAWLFVQWATSYSVQHEKAKTVFYGNRTSIFQDPAMATASKAICNGMWLQATLDDLKVANPDFRPRVDNWLEVGDRLSLAVQAAISGSSVSDQLNSAQDDITKIMKQAGY